MRFWTGVRFYSTPPFFLHSVNSQGLEMSRDEEPEECQDTSHVEDPEHGHPDHRRWGGYTRKKNKPLSKNKRKIVKQSRRKNR